jgi:hypothetical protein
MLLLLSACIDPCDDRASIGYPDPDCPAQVGHLDGDDSGTGSLDADECLGIGFERTDGVLNQFCMECGAVICQYRTVSRTALGGVEVEIVGAIAVDPDWAEYHDDFNAVATDDLSVDDGRHRRELVLMVTDDADIWASNTNTLFNFSLPEVQQSVSMEISVMLPDGTYPECILFGNQPERFQDTCEEIPL